jgi:GDP-L-fucose synthase
MNKKDLILVTGYRGLVGSAIVRRLQAEGFFNLLLADRGEIDLRDQHAVDSYFDKHTPAYVILAAAKVGGIKANMREPGEFLADNLSIELNVINGCLKHKAKKLVFLGSSCIYPRECLQPMKEEYLLTGPLEPTNEGYALAKIAGIRLVQYYAGEYGFKAICPNPCNLYGPGEGFNLETSHVLSALVKRFCDAVEAGAEKVVLWGTGSARREFMHVDDMARAVLFLIERWDSPEVINVGVGVDYTIKELAGMVAGQAGYKGKISWDSSMPDGMPRKIVDISKIAALGFRASIPIEEGISGMIMDYRSAAGIGGGRSRQ